MTQIIVGPDLDPFYSQTRAILRQSLAKWDQTDGMIGIGFELNSKGLTSLDTSTLSVIVREDAEVMSWIRPQNLDLERLSTLSYAGFLLLGDDNFSTACHAALEEMPKGPIEIIVTASGVLFLSRDEIIRSTDIAAERMQLVAAQGASSHERLEISVGVRSLTEYGNSVLARCLHEASDFRMAPPAT